MAGRSELLERARVALSRVRAGRAEKSMVAVGFRGVGKTVLLNRMREVAEGVGFRTSIVEAHEDKPLPLLLLYSPTHGDTAFTVPMLDEFMKWTMPEWRPRA